MYYLQCPVFSLLLDGQKIGHFDPQSGKEAININWIQMDPNIGFSRRRHQSHCYKCVQKIKIYSKNKNNVYKEVQENIISMSKQMGNLHRQTDTVENGNSRTDNYSNWKINLLGSLDISFEVAKERIVAWGQNNRNCLIQNAESDKDWGKLNRTSETSDFTCA